MNLPEIVSQYLVVCSEAYRLLLEENRALKQNRQSPELLERKRGLLRILSGSVHDLRALNSTARPPNGQDAALVRTAQESVLKVLLLDRENEQLLLKCTMLAQPAAVAARASSSALQKAYGTGAALRG